MKSAPISLLAAAFPSSVSELDAGGASVAVFSASGLGGTVVAIGSAAPVGSATAGAGRAAVGGDADATGVAVAAGWIVSSLTWAPNRGTLG